MKAKGFVALLMVIILAVSAAACGGEAKEPAEEIADAAVAAYAGLDTYQFDMDMTMEMNITTAEGVVEGMVTVKANGASDKANQKKYMNMQMSADYPEAVESELEQYTIDDYMYLKVDVPGELPRWVKWKLCRPCGGGEEDIVSQQVDLLKNATDVKHIDTEALDGTKCYVLEVSPDLEKLWQWIQEQQMIGERLPSLGSDPAQAINDFSINQWIAKDTYFTLKSTLDVTLSFSLRASSLLASACPSCGLIPPFPADFVRTCDITVTVVVYDINQPVTIELPPEAEGAEEVPIPGLY